MFASWRGRPRPSSVLFQCACELDRLGHAFFARDLLHAKADAWSQTAEQAEVLTLDLACRRSFWRELELALPRGCHRRGGFRCLRWLSNSRLGRCLVPRQDSERRREVLAQLSADNRLDASGEITNNGFDIGRRL